MKTLIYQGVSVAVRVSYSSPDRWRPPDGGAMGCGHL